jgi:hypothetical protein
MAQHLWHLLGVLRPRWVHAERAVQLIKISRTVWPAGGSNLADDAAERFKDRLTNSVFLKHRMKKLGKSPAAAVMARAP